MPVRDPVFHPPFNVVRASHVELGVRDLARSRAFYVDCLGYWSVTKTADALYLRGVEERNHHSIVLRTLDASRGARARLQARQAKTISTAPPFWFERRKLPVALPDAAVPGPDAAHRRPVGMPLDLYFRMDAGRRCCRSTPPTRARASSASTIINCFTPDVQASYDFYTELGFRLTEYTETEDADPQLWAVWMQRKGNVTTSPSPMARPAAASHRRMDRRARSTSCTSAT